MQETTTKIKIKTYYELTKPKIWYLLVFTAFGTAITASNIYNIEISIATWALMLFGVAVRIKIKDNLIKILPAVFYCLLNAYLSFKLIF